VADVESKALTRRARSKEEKPYLGMRNRGTVLSLGIVFLCGLCTLCVEIFDLSSSVNHDSPAACYRQFPTKMIDKNHGGA